MVARIEGNELVIRLPMTTPTLSPTGKTKSVASSHGNKATEVIVEGQKVIVGVNAYIYANKR
jgi:hypothetical protein